MSTSKNWIVKELIQCWWLGLFEACKWKPFLKASLWPLARPGRLESSEKGRHSKSGAPLRALNKSRGGTVLAAGSSIKYSQIRSRSRSTLLERAQGRASSFLAESLCFQRNKGQGMRTREHLCCGMQQGDSMSPVQFLFLLSRQSVANLSRITSKAWRDQGNNNGDKMWPFSLVRAGTTCWKSLCPWKF